ncbi:hypothetical protein K438DRAFT_1907951 [Mycena galopus ATCC 62051]|nr:hypothetical protein K438DRAFT_1907951 [Mycena galopus ATCC 62051]
MFPPPLSISRHTLSLSKPVSELKIATDVEPFLAGEDSPNSLFDEASPTSGVVGKMTPATLHAPPIPGLFFTPSLLLPLELANEVTDFCLANYFNQPGVNQIMLFGRSAPILATLLSTVSSLLEPTLPSEIHALLFPRNPTRARQAILNLYYPGEGIIPHVDLLRRFGNGIVGVSLGSSCVMEFAPVESESTADKAQLFLPERSVIVLSGDARYAWTHGIEKRTADLVADGDEHRVFSLQACHKPSAPVPIAKQ